MEGVHVSVRTKGVLKSLNRVKGKYNGINKMKQLMGLNMTAESGCNVIYGSSKLDVYIPLVTKGCKKVCNIMKVKV